MDKNQNKILFLIMGAALVLSLAHSFYFKIQPHVDSRAYDRIAVNLISGNGYIENPAVPVEKDFAITRVGPGYEFFLAGVYFLFGHRYEVVWILQAIFHALSALFVFLIAKEIFRSAWHPFIGLAAAALVGFSPDLIVASSMLLAENLAIFLLLVSVYFFFRHLAKQDWLSFFSSAVFLGFASLIRSPSIIIALAFAGVFVFKKQWLKLFLLIFLIALIFIPWTIRNYDLYGQFIPFSSALGYDLWVGNHEGASGELEYFQPLVDYFAGHDPIEVNRYGLEKFGEFLSGHPLEFIEITFRRLSIYFSLFRPSGFWPYFSPFQQVITAFFSGIYSVLIFVFGFSGILLAFKYLSAEEKYSLKILLAMALLTPLSIMFIVVETRYRFPVYPFLAVFGGFGLHCVFKLKKGFLTLFLVFSVFLLNACFDFFSNGKLFMERLKNLI